MRLVVLCILGWATFAHGQALERTCLAGSDTGFGIDVAVDTAGTVHLSRIARVTGELVHTTVAPDGSETQSVVAANISVFPDDEVRDTGIVADELGTHICFYNARQGRFEVATRSGNAWLRETIQNGADNGRTCDLIRYQGLLVATWPDSAGRLRVSSRSAGGTWSTAIADSAGGKVVGQMPRATFNGNTFVVAHYNATDQRLRLTWKVGGGAWQTTGVDGPVASTGWSATPLLFDDGTMVVFHGTAPPSPDSGADGNTLESYGTLGGGFNTGTMLGASSGGSVAAVRNGDTYTVFSRQRQRSALFGSSDALFMYAGDISSGVTFSTLEQYGPAESRHSFLFLAAASDPFGLPLMAYNDDNNQASLTCLYRPIDSDDDGIPDTAEGDLGTDRNDPDTDGDGRTDGQEVLIDGTDPLDGGACVPRAERCDGQDDDCDGRVDEDVVQACYPAPVGTIGVGPCRRGTQTCAGGGFGACQGAVVPQDEICNGVDDDCDGLKDEGNPGGGAPCDAGGVGQCGEGAEQCQGGRQVCVAVDAAAPEQCNGLDDDCDGDVDEGDTTCGVGACLQTAPNCIGGDPNPCTPGAPGANDASCNAIDNDCDARTDEDYPTANTNCGVGACRRAGLRRCRAGRVENTCVAGQPAANDATCDNTDNDCDGQTDEDYQPGPSACGVGACARVGAAQCVNGALVDDCRPGAPAANDASCDGIDDDCDGRVDEDFELTPVQCGVGSCTASGTRECVNGQVVERCQPEQPGLSDAICDGLDEDCDGRTDEDARPRPIQCGIGACSAEGNEECQDGVAVRVCDPGAPAADDSVCDSIDADCDGQIDEDAADVATTCGVGACESDGVLHCSDGVRVDNCEPGAPAALDTSCDGVDDDCDGRVDEDFVERISRCGRGVCEANGAVRCVNGAAVDNCAAGAPTGDDTDCNAEDEDCDGLADEGYQGRASSCGRGACAADGMFICLNGAESNQCQPGPPGADDRACDGVDADCDGRTDEGFRSQRTRCGTGLCAQTGRTACSDGELSDTCVPGPPLGNNDAICDGTDADCDGRVDEDFVEFDTICGDGACRANGRRQCRNGEIEDTCRSAPSADDDVACDAIDDDCDGEVDEDYAPSPTFCGLGACRREGATTCRNGNQGDSCRPGAPASDDSCDGVDDDCDGRVDEAFQVVNTACGQGSCSADGQRICRNGQVVNTCRAGQPTADDHECDGLDSDCDGRTDEDFVAQPTACGEGQCANLGETQCLAGRVRDTCLPRAPSGNDTTCDGLDQDCDGSTDEGYVEPVSQCGAGACRAQGHLVCTADGVVDSCVPGAPSANDATCDGRDDDCDGSIDENFAPSVTGCGVGACTAAGQRVCRNGRAVNTCLPGSPDLTDTCDGEDSDCDGDIDEGFQSQATVCGDGVCAGAGATACEGGRVVDSCAQGAPTDDDANCDGEDGDCDGSLDEDFPAGPSTCGLGVCAGQGVTACVNGQSQDSCEVGRTTGDDNDCDGLDDDCDGRVDERFQRVATACGVGACQARGERVCQGGETLNTCVAGDISGPDQDCDGADQDCDGEIDEGYVEAVLNCGVGACAAEGLRACQAGSVTERCVPGAPALEDSTCNGQDDDCDGEADEDFDETGISCGVGACRSDGLRTCVAGAIDADCVPGQPAAEDSTCDGIDDDCDGTADEDAVPGPSECGAGACAAIGEVRCVAGRSVDSCEPGFAGATDVTCDAIDDDCDGRTDESFASEATSCGIGECAARGRSGCENGQLTDSCEAFDPLVRFDICDGTDGDCDGRIDEDSARGQTSCGVGACARIGRNGCIDGQPLDDCNPGAPADGDLTCDGVDEDCDGVADEDVQPRATVCGAGACAADGIIDCVDGAQQVQCEPADPAADDATCDRLDDDCDGIADEDATLEAVTCGVGACAAVGTAACREGEVLVECLPGDPVGEDVTCDAIDDDCDGATDEAFVGESVRCGVGACEREGATACVDNAIFDVCEPGEPARADATCDGEDDDCDGVVDEECMRLPDGGPDGDGSMPDGGTPDGAPDGGLPDGSGDAITDGALPDGQSDGQSDGQTDGQSDGQTDAGSEDASDGTFGDACVGEECGAAAPELTRARSGCSECSTGGDGETPWWVLFAVLGLATRRRRREV